MVGVRSSFVLGPDKSVSSWSRFVPVTYPSQVQGRRIIPYLLSAQCCCRTPSTMASEKHNIDIVPAEKEGVIQTEYAADAEKQGAKVDYSGAHEKTDPVEIALVRKLDRWIMPMYVIPAMATRAAMVC